MENPNNGSSQNKIISMKAVDCDNQCVAEVSFKYDKKGRINQVISNYCNDYDWNSDWTSSYEYTNKEILNTFKQKSYIPLRLITNPYYQYGDYGAIVFRDTMCLNKNRLVEKELMSFTAELRIGKDHYSSLGDIENINSFQWLLDPQIVARPNGDSVDVSVTDYGTSDVLYSSDKEIIAKVGSHTGTDSFVWNDGLLEEIQGFDDVIVHVTYTHKKNPLINQGVDVTLPLLLVGMGYLPYIPNTLLFPGYFGIQSEWLIDKIQIDHSRYADYYELKYSFDADNLLRSILIYSSSSYYYNVTPEFWLRFDLIYE